MEIILKQDIQNLGSKDDIVTVKDGYARNYLIPKGLAIIATPSAKKKCWPKLFVSVPIKRKNCVRKRCSWPKK